MTLADSKPYGYAMLVLFVLFAFRVFAQLVQGWRPVSYLPSFDTWQSGALPYPFLLVAQIFILLTCATAIWQFITETVVPSERRGKVTLILGIVYFTVMLVRLAAGFTVATEHFWFRARLPTLFHLVLATFLIVYGYFHFAYSRSSADLITRNQP